jgi:hypothetical protein
MAVERRAIAHCTSKGGLADMPCPQCHFDNPPGMRFCGQCGSRLPEVSVASVAVAERISDAPDAEHRHVTLTFIDVVNYTSLSEELDPEVLRDVVLQYQTRSAGVIQIFEGHIANRGSSTWR